MLHRLTRSRSTTKLLSFFEVPVNALPTIRSSAEPLGTVIGTSFAGIPITGVCTYCWMIFRDANGRKCLGDQQAALLGQNCLRPGETKSTFVAPLWLPSSFDLRSDRYGTGCFLLCNSGTRPVFSEKGLLTTVAFQLGPAAPVFYAVEGSVAIAGAGVRWLRDNLGIIGQVSEIGGQRCS